MGEELPVIALAENDKKIPISPRARNSAILNAMSRLVMLHKGTVEGDKYM